jgi:hypothetical protein
MSLFKRKVSVKEMGEELGGTILGAFDYYKERVHSELRIGPRTGKHVSEIFCVLLFEVLRACRSKYDESIADMLVRYTQNFFIEAWFGTDNGTLEWSTSRYQTLDLVDRRMSEYMKIFRDALPDASRAMQLYSLSMSENIGGKADAVNAMTLALYIATFRSAIVELFKKIKI